MCKNHEVTIPNVDYLRLPLLYQRSLWMVPNIIATFWEGYTFVPYLAFLAFTAGTVTRLHILTTILGKGSQIEVKGFFN